MSHEQPDVRTTTRDFPITPPVPGVLTRWLAGERGDVAPARPAATVMLVRNGVASDPAPEVFMLRRTATMAFAPSAVVFPGGGVDPRDDDPDLPWAGPSAQEWAVALDADESQARELVIAAIRELFEECGVLLAGPDATSTVPDAALPSYRAARDALVRKEIAFSQFLEREGLLLRTDLLRVRGHWITPEHARKRYDTRIFAATVPRGQHPDDATSEAVEGWWAQPSQVLREYGGDIVGMLPPTVWALEQLASCGSAQEFLDLPALSGPVMPVLVESPDGPVLRVVLRVVVQGAAPGTTA